MNPLFQTWKSARLMLKELISPLSVEQLNHIPENYSNNIIWNIGHIIAVQQSLSYLATGNSMLMDNILYRRYKPGSKPHKTVSEKEIVQLKALLERTTNDCIMDYKSKKIRHQYRAFSTTKGFHVKNIEEALSFNLFHEGVHIGIIQEMHKHV